jgi:hypothetical protein
MNNTTTEKSIDYNKRMNTLHTTGQVTGLDIVEVYSADREIGAKESFFGDIVTWKLSDGSDVFDVNLAKQTASAPDEKSATGFLYELQLLCKKHGIVFEESF